MREFLENTKLFFESMRGPNQDLKNSLKEVKTDMKNLIKQHSPVIGRVIEKADRVGQAARNLVDANDPIKAIGRQLKAQHDLDLADHLCVQMPGFTHHGLYIGNHKVIHYSKGQIRMDSLEEFQKFSKIIVLDSPITRSRKSVISRAKIRLGEKEYNVVFNNCEHFVTWCRSGGEYSDTI
jgi:hypothetical protein